MFQPIPVKEDNVFAYKATGKLTDEDYAKFVPEIEKLIDGHGKISLLFELENFKGWGPKSAWQDYRFGKEQDEHFDKIAIVGERAWQRWMTLIANFFTDANIRYYKRDELAQAWDWLRDVDEPVDGTTIEPVPYRNILVPVDFSPHAVFALKRGAKMATQNDAQLTLLHVVDRAVPLDTYDTFGMTPQYAYSEIEQELFDASADRLGNLARESGHPNVKFETLWGFPKTTIVSYAEAQRIDLIITGSHGHHGLERLLGSTASSLASKARCDVLVVKLPT